MNSLHLPTLLASARRLARTHISAHHVQLKKKGPLSTTSSFEHTTVEMICFNDLRNEPPTILELDSSGGPYVALPLTFRGKEFAHAGQSLTVTSWIDVSRVSLSRGAVGLITEWTVDVPRDRSNKLWARVVRNILSRFQVIISVEEFTMDAEILIINRALILTYGECVEVNCGILGKLARRSFFESRP